MYLCEFDPSAMGLESGLDFGTTMGPRTRLFMPPYAQPDF